MPQSPRDISLPGNLDTETVTTVLSKILKWDVYKQSSVTDKILLKLPKLCRLSESTKRYLLTKIQLHTHLGTQVTLRSEQGKISKEVLNSFLDSYIIRAKKCNQTQ